MSDVRTLDVLVETGENRWDHVHVFKLAGREAVSAPFELDVDLVADDDHGLPDDARVGEEICLVFEVDGVESRRIHGMIDAIRTRIDDASPLTFRLRVVPRFARLAHVRTQEVALAQSLPAIVQGKLERHGFEASDFDFRLLGRYAERELVLQFMESDLDFVRRHLEHLGIAFYFSHDDGKDRLVLTDHEEGYTPLRKEVPFLSRGEKGGVFALQRVEARAPTSYIVQDYNYRAPLVELSEVCDLESGTGGGVVEYGAHVKTPEEARQLARVRAEEQRGQQLRFEGESGVVELSAGRRITLLDVPGAEGPEPLLVVEVQHELTIPRPGALTPEGTKAHYVNRFCAVPSGFMFRPARQTPRPSLSGTVTGVVQPGTDGEIGGVADLDSDGRYLVQFHFDTAPPGRAKSSHRVRMAQPFAGSGYGMHLPLRRGTEVLVAFTHGDPDRPVILGALYNATSPNPVAAANANVHQIKSNKGVTFEFGTKS